MEEETVIKAAILVLLIALFYAGASHSGSAASGAGAHGGASTTIGVINGQTGHWHTMPGRYGLTTVEGHAVPLASTYRDATYGTADIVYDAGTIHFDTLGYYVMSLSTHRAVGRGESRVNEAEKSTVSRGFYSRRGDEIMLYTGTAQAPLVVGQGRVVQDGLVVTLNVGNEADRRPSAFLFLVPQNLPARPAGT